MANNDSVVIRRPLVADNALWSNRVIKWEGLLVIATLLMWFIPLKATGAGKPVSYFGVRLELASDMAYPGDEFWVTGYLDNPGPDALLEAPVCFALDVYGEYWFWPSWAHYAPPEHTDYDLRCLPVPIGSSAVEVIEPFIWPDTGDSSVDNLFFYGLMLNDDLSAVRGTIACVKFGYGPRPSTPTCSPDPSRSPTANPTPTPPATCSPSSSPTIAPSPTRTPTSWPTPSTTPSMVPGFVSVGNMLTIPAGSFIQGSPVDEPCRYYNETQFSHCLTRSLAVMETEVTRQMWADLRAVQPSLRADPSNTDCSPTLNYPMQNITWYDSALFANLLSVQNGYTRCYYTDADFTIPIDGNNYVTEPYFCNFDANGYRLPTEGEWEYFARAGTTGPFSCTEINYASDNCHSCIVGLHPTLELHCVYCRSYPGCEAAGSKLANPWGLKDVHGNVWEWCWDWYSDYPTTPQVDYAGPLTGRYRSWRGGSWGYAAVCVRSASRDFLPPNGFEIFQGFRLVRSISGAHRKIKF